MALEMISRGGWSGRAVAQQRPRVSKLGLKELFNHNSNEIAVEAARREASEPNKRAVLTKYLLKKGGNWTTALSLTKQGQKAAYQRKIPLVRKSYSFYLPVEPITSPCDSAWSTEG
jgi:hypothetical protein